MSKLSDQELAMALFALGADEGDARAATSRRVETEPALHEALAAWSDGMAGIGLSVDPVDPPDDLFAKIEAKVDAESLPQTHTVRHGAGKWVNMCPGVWRKVLNRNRETGQTTLLLRCEPGSVIPSHDHDHDEELMMLEGSVTFGGLTLQAGDFHHARKGSAHLPATTEGGCLILIRC